MLPIGHRVEVTWLQKVERGLVPSQVRTGERPHQPSIRYLDTGIVYQTDWGTGHGGRSLPDTPHEISDVPLEDFHVHRRVVGVVTACRVVAIRDTRNLDVQTHLRIEVE